MAWCPGTLRWNFIASPMPSKKKVNGKFFTTRLTLVTTLVMRMCRCIVQEIIMDSLRTRLASMDSGNHVYRSCLEMDTIILSGRQNTFHILQKEFGTS